MSKSDYVQRTVRLPAKLDEMIEQYAKEWGLTYQDAIVHILLECFEGEE
ncbi:hypothetical protein [Pyrodictium delaneyi]|nr:hypothetical protein [Pyrodictium delaneyi]